MPLGSIARQILGQRFYRLGRWYRSLFANLETVADVIASVLPPNAIVLDVGAGDGETLNYLLARRPDVRVAMLDISPSCGTAIENAYRARISVLAGTELSQYRGESPDAILLTDVMHHVPISSRTKFLGDIRAAVARFSVPLVVVKDVESGTFRGFLGWLSDRFVSGDRNVSLMRSSNLAEALRRALGPHVTVTQTDLITRDYPNYCLLAEILAADCD